MDKVVQKLVGLGIPGLVLLVAIATSGVAGGAAIMVALATLGGPFGMLGGFALLGILTLVADALAKFGLEKIFAAVVTGLVERGHSQQAIRDSIRSYPLTSEFKSKILSYL